MTSDEGNGGERRSLVETRALSYSYVSSGRELVTAVKDVNLKIFEGEFLSIIGQNGAGKTTLAKHFNGLLKPSAGQVYVEGVETSGRSVAQLASSVGYVFQDPDRMLFRNTVEDELTFGPNNLGLGPDEVKKRTDEVAAYLDLTQYFGASPFQLGKSAKRRLAIASILTIKPKMIVIDEPSVGQDRSRADRLMGYLRRLNKEDGTTVAVITHDMRLVAEYCDRALVLSSGELLFDGRVRALFKEGKEGGHVLERSALEPPQITRLSMSMPDLFPEAALSVDEAVKMLT